MAYGDWEAAAGPYVSVRSEPASLPAQEAWARYWARHVTRAIRRDDPGGALPESRESLTGGWLTALDGLDRERRLAAGRRAG